MHRFTCSNNIVLRHHCGWGLLSTCLTCLTWFFLILEFPRLGNWSTWRLNDLTKTLHLGNDGLGLGNMVPPVHGPTCLYRLPGRLPWPSTSRAGSSCPSQARPIAQMDNGTLTHLHPSTSSWHLCWNTFPPLPKHTPPAAFISGILHHPCEVVTFLRVRMRPYLSMSAFPGLHTRSVPLCPQPPQPTLHSALKDLERALSLFIMEIAKHTPKKNISVNGSRENGLMGPCQPSSAALNIFSVLSCLFILDVFAWDRK